MTDPSRFGLWRWASGPQWFPSLQKLSSYLRRKGCFHTIGCCCLIHLHHHPGVRLAATCGWVRGLPPSAPSEDLELLRLEWVLPLLQWLLLGSGPCGRLFVP